MGDTMSSSSSSNAYSFVLCNYPLISAIVAQSTKFFTTRPLEVPAKEIIFELSCSFISKPVLSCGCRQRWRAKHFIMTQIPDNGREVIPENTTQTNNKKDELI
ncbi:hypothetical protein MUK42_35313 [Musa troglodytarum]|uniref:Uncharacterized protein n=1 Tax=Musa troglodytarum TaxID=320322 RepID=A0A9E7H789_9LILI|nr:hypothetical protein MUK42_35313 [Musa troglodytarum]